jgi:threonine/homoserine/homoserine lactone efflux protein
MPLDLYLAYVLACILIWIFDWLRYAGAAYLVWLGWKFLRAPRRSSSSARSSRSSSSRRATTSRMVVALFSDGAYAVLTGRAGVLLSRNRVRLVSRLSGVCLIGGGLWLALTRSR